MCCCRKTCYKLLLVCKAKPSRQSICYLFSFCYFISVWVWEEIECGFYSATMVNFPYLPSNRSNSHTQPEEKKHQTRQQIIIPSFVSYTILVPLFYKQNISFSYYFYYAMAQRRDASHASFINALVGRESSKLLSNFMK